MTMDGTIEIKFPAGASYSEMANLILDIINQTDCAVGVNYHGMPLWIHPGAGWTDLEREFALAMGKAGIGRKVRA